MAGATASQISDEFVKTFERRAALLRTTAALVLLIVFALLGTAGYIFLRAPELASRDIAAQADERKTLEDARGELEAARAQFEIGQLSPLDMLKKEKRVYEQMQRSEIAQRRRRIYQDAAGALPADAFADLQEVEIALRTKEQLLRSINTVKDLVRQQIEAGIGANSDGLAVDLELVRVERELEDLRRQRDRFTALRDDGNAGPALTLKEERAPRNATHLIQTNIYRFGTLLVVFFFIAILQPIFRYNTQLAAYYDARADALLLFRSSTDRDLTALTAVLTPRLAFEKDKTEPAQQSTEIIGEMIKAAAKQDRK